MAREQIEHLAGIFRRNAERTALVDVRNDDALTYGELLERSLKLAGALKQRGIGAGDCVAMSMTNCQELCILYFACMHLGAISVPINTVFHPQDYAEVLKKNTPGLFVVSPSVLARVQDELAGLPDVEMLCFRPTVERTKSATEGLVNFDFTAEIERQSIDVEPFAAPSDEDTLLIVTTSGTTSAPKGVEISYYGLLANARAFNGRLGVGRDNRFYNLLPMAYLGGFYNLMLLPLVGEGSFALDSTFGAANMYAFWERVEDYEINTLWFNSTMLSMLLSLEDDQQQLGFLREQVRLALVGMAPLPVDLKKRFEQRFGFTLYENYGLSETAFLTTAAPELACKEGSVGKKLPEVEIRVVDAAGAEVPDGSEGQIVVRTPCLMKGYRHAGESDRQNCLPGGEFLTGDIGYFDADGELFITGRVKDLIIRGGVNISPKAIEDVIYKYDTVEEAAVIGVPHPVYGEEVVAIIKIRAGDNQTTPEDIRTFCEDHLANYQRPKFVYFIDEMPKGATGKIQKSVLKRLIQKKMDPLGSSWAA